MGIGPSLKTFPSWKTIRILEDLVSAGLHGKLYSNLAANIVECDATYYETKPAS